MRQSVLDGNLHRNGVGLGIKPSADKVEVVELKYQYRRRSSDRK
jgi:hypothetical protein